MSTRSSARNLFPPLDNPKLTIQRRSRADPTLLNNFEIAAEGNGDPTVPDLQTMEELCQPSLNGRGRPIAPIAIQATNFGLKNDLIQQVQNSCQFHGLLGDDANKHLDKFLHVTQSIKVNGVTDDALCLYLFPHSLTHHATDWFDRLPRNSINTFEQMAKIFLGKYFPPSMVTKLRNEITNFHQRPDKSLFEAWNQGNHHPQGNNQGRNQFFQGASHGQNPPPAYQAPAYQASGYQALVHQPPIHQPQVVTTNEFTNYMKPNDAILKNMQTNMTSLTNSNLELKNMFGQFMKMNTTSYSGLENIPGPTIPTTSSSLPPVVERETEVTKDMVPPTNNGSTKNIQPSVVQTKTPIQNFKPVVAPVSAPKPNQKPSIPYPSRLHDQKLHDKANDQKENFFQIFKDLDFNISFADALILMPKFGPTIKTLLTNKDKLTLKLVDRSISHPVGVAEDVFVKVGTFYFLADFVVVDFDADPRYRNKTDRLPVKLDHLQELGKRRLLRGENHYPRMELKSEKRLKQLGHNKEWDCHSRSHQRNQELLTNTPHKP
nr:reverse transcriptase domain-containing protein [Tanacetum cinerariifolium]